MSISLPNLDNRTFADLVDELRALIPRYAPTWTDHNASDPGITLIELFAFVAETLIYRLNRIPDASEVRFLELLGVVFGPAVPAAVKLTITADGLQYTLPILLGTPLIVSNPQGGEVLPFRTARDLQLTPNEPSGSVMALQMAFIQGEQLGISNNRSYQTFPLANSFLILNIEGKLEVQSPIVPEITVGGETWTYRTSLLDSAADDRHFIIEPYFNAIRFGNGGSEGGTGTLPPAGAKVVASYYYTLGAKGNLPPGTEFVVDTDSSLLAFSLKEALGSGVSLSITTESGASGGVNPTSLKDARYQASSALKSCWRAITADDFETLVLSENFAALMAGEEFADRFQGQDIPQIARAKCLPEMDLTASDPTLSCPGHVSVIVVPEGEDEEDTMPQPSQAFLETVWDILDQRRLITCRHHVVGPIYTDVCMRAEVSCTPQAPKDDVAEQIMTNLEDFFHPLYGGPQLEQEGWPFGRNIYASEVYQIIEGTYGVDHVTSLTLYSREEGGSWTKVADKIAIAPNNLVHFDCQSSRISTRV